MNLQYKMEFTHRKMPDRNPEIMNLLYKYGAVATYVIIGLLGKFGLDIVSGRKLSGWYVLGTGFMAVFMGWISWIWCQKFPEMNPGIVVPVATLVSRDIILFLTMVDYMGVLRIIVGKDPKNKK